MVIHNNTYVVGSVLLCSFIDVNGWPNSNALWWHRLQWMTVSNWIWLRDPILWLWFLKQMFFGAVSSWLIGSRLFMIDSLMSALCALQLLFGIIDFRKCALACVPVSVWSLVFRVRIYTILTAYYFGLSFFRSLLFPWFF